MAKNIKKINFATEPYVKIVHDTEAGSLTFTNINGRPLEVPLGGSSSDVNGKIEITGDLSGMLNTKLTDTTNNDYLLVSSYLDPTNANLPVVRLMQSDSNGSYVDIYDIPTMSLVGGNASIATTGSTTTFTATVSSDADHFYLVSSHFDGNQHEIYNQIRSNVANSYQWVSYDDVGVQNYVSSYAMPLGSITLTHDDMDNFGYLKQDGNNFINWMTQSYGLDWYVVVNGTQVSSIQLVDKNYVDTAISSFTPEPMTIRLPLSSTSSYYIGSHGTPLDHQFMINITSPGSIEDKYLYLESVGSSLNDAGDPYYAWKIGTSWIGTNVTPGNIQIDVILNPDYGTFDASLLKNFGVSSYFGVEVAEGASSFSVTLTPGSTIDQSYIHFDTSSSLTQYYILNRDTGIFYKLYEAEQLDAYIHGDVNGDTNWNFNGCNRLNNEIRIPPVAQGTNCILYCQHEGDENLITANDDYSALDTLATAGRWLMAYLYCDCHNLTSLTHPISLQNLVTADYSCLREAFSSCTSLSSIQDFEFDQLSSVANQFMDSCFANCSSLITAPNITLDALNTAGAFFLQETYRNCANIAIAPVISTQSLNTVGSSFMHGTFYQCTSLSSVPSLDVSQISSISMEFMQATFQGCSSLVNVPTLSFDSLTSTSMPSGAYYILDATFYQCSSLVVSTYQRPGASLFIAPNLTSVPNGVTVLHNAFDGCILKDISKDGVPTDGSKTALEQLQSGIWIGGTDE